MTGMLTPSRRELLHGGAALAAAAFAGGLAPAVSQQASAATATSLKGKVGAFVDRGAYHTRLGASILEWENIVGRPLAAHRVYLGKAPVAIYSDLEADARAGRKVCMSLKPPCDPPTRSARAAISSFLASCKAAGLRADVALWHEPYYQGITSAAKFITMFRYYAPAIREYYPAVFCTSTSSVRYHGENRYFPGAAYVDKCATDYYCYAYVTHGTRLGTGTSTDAAHPADTYHKPFGLWEFASSTDPSLGQSRASATAFFKYLRTYFSGRTTTGKRNADLLMMDNGQKKFQSTPITSASDYRIPLYQAIFDTLNA